MRPSVSNNASSQFFFTNLSGVNARQQLISTTASKPSFPASSGAVRAGSAGSSAWGGGGREGPLLIDGGCRRELVQASGPLMGARAVVLLLGAAVLKQAVLKHGVLELKPGRSPGPEIPCASRAAAPDQ